MTRTLYIILLMILGISCPNYLLAQATADSVATTDTLPEPDRLADDFVHVSLCIADPTDWRDDALGTAGHAFLRMQCPYYGLDYCFSYEGEEVKGNLNRYLSGKSKMGYFVFYTDSYLEDYRRWNRTVHEYALDLPPEAKTRLWEIMDNHLTNKISLRHDLNRYGCAITIVRYIKKALNGTSIDYMPCELDNLTRREIGYRSLSNHPWLRLTHMLFTDSRYDKKQPIDEKLIIPADLAQVWQEATVNGRTLATYKGDIVEGATLSKSKPWFTPMLLSIVLLIISCCMQLTKYKYWNYLMVGLATAIGVVLIYLWIVMSGFGSSAYLVMILCNPLQALLWHWRKYWALPYAAVLLVGVVVLALLPHSLIDPAILVFALSYVAIYAKEGWALIRR